MKKNIAMVITLALLAVPLSLAQPANADTAPYWDVSGNHVIQMEFEGNDYAHDMSLSQDDDGDLTGNGGYPAGGAHTYTWVIDSGSVEGNDLSFTAHYTASADAVTPLTILEVEGTVSASGTMSGTWSDNYQGGSRSGTWTTGTSTVHLLGSLAAEDFGVVNYDTGLGTLAGYSAGFGLTDATFEDVQSVVVKLYAAGDVLLQTNTATAKVGDEITGNQISSPFDVSGNFDYATDGYWDNDRESEYGQSVPAVKVVATVTLANGKVVTATNTNLTGDPSTIMDDDEEEPEPPKPPKSQDACKNGGWKTFTNPSFKNQGQCVKAVVK